MFWRRVLILGSKRASDTPVALTAMLWSILCLCKLFLLAQAVTYDPSNPGPNAGHSVTSGNFYDLEILFLDWKTLTTKPGPYFPVSVADLFKNQIKEEKKVIINVLSGDIKFNQFTFYGLNEQNWKIQKGKNPGHKYNDVCFYSQNETKMAERYYGNFGVRLESFETKAVLTVNGTQKECDVVGLTRRRYFKNLQNDFMYIAFDYAYIWQPPIETEVKVWKVDKKINRPRFSVYVDPKCLNLPWDQIRHLNLALTDHLHHTSSLLNLISGIMKEHFLAWVGEPYGKYKVSQANG